MSGQLPAQYEKELERLGAAAWRERKQAAGRLRDWVSDDRTRLDIMEPLAERLLDGLLSSEALDGRAACHEVLVAIGPPSVPSIVRRLDSPAPSLRLLVDLLGEVGATEQIPRLISILESEDAEINLRASAATALGRLGGAAACDALVGLLAQPSEMLVIHSLDALGQAKARVGVAELEDLAKRPFSRKSAITVMGSCRDAAALPVLLAGLDDSMAGVRAAAALSLTQLEAELDEEQKGGIVGAALARSTEPTRRQIRALISHRDRMVRGAAIRLAALAKDAPAVEVVLGVMDDPLLVEDALAMVSVLGAAAAPIIVRCSRQVGSGAREHLLRLVGALRAESVDAEVLTFVAASLADPSEDTAIAAAEALAIVGSRAALGEIYRAMGTDGRLGEAAADAMAAVLLRIGGGNAHDDLQLIVGGTWPETGPLARNLCRAVGQLGSARYAPHLVSMLGSPDVGVRVGAANALGQLEGEHEGAGALSFALTDEEPQVRAAACRSLGALRAPSSVGSLTSATTDRAPSVRAAAVTALVELDNPVALARLRAIIAEDPVTTVVVAAIAGLGSSSLDHDLTMLMSLCTSADWEVVKAAARALQGFRAHRATAALLGLLSHERWDVRWAAAEVLSSRGDPTALQPLRGALSEEGDRLVAQVIGEAIERLERSA